MSKAIYTSIDAFPYCCGIQVLGNLSTYKDYQQHTIRERVIDDETIYEDGNEGSALMATTIDSQKAAITQLKKYGFKKLTSFVNPSSDNKVTIWMRKPTKA